MDIVGYQRGAWDGEVDRKCKWTIPVDGETIAKARDGEFSILLTPERIVPLGWFGELKGADVLCLAGGGGQQGPVLSAAGANVTVFDNSPKQLAQDRLVAERESLDIRLVQGDMADLSEFADASFDLIFHPCSNCFVKDVRPVWREAGRVLRVGGHILSGFANPARYIFDDQKAEKERELLVRHKLPFSEFTDISEQERQYYIDRNEPMLFGHTLEDQIGGQADAGLAIVGFFEDYEKPHVIADFMPTYIATRAVKLP